MQDMVSFKGLQTDSFKEDIQCTMYTEHLIVLSFGVGDVVYVLNIFSTHKIKSKYFLWNSQDIMKIFPGKHIVNGLHFIGSCHFRSTKRNLCLPTANFKHGVLVVFTSPHLYLCILHLKMLKSFHISICWNEQVKNGYVGGS